MLYFCSMFAYLKGEITFRNPAFVVLEVGGIGYHVHIPLSTYTAIAQAEKATLYTHLQIKEDAHTLYGFATQVEKGMFIQLIGVTGVGATTAQLILSSMSVDEVRSAILSDAAHILQRVKGIGAKTAKQIILDLKTKVAKESPDAPLLLPTAEDNQMREEALSALLALGFNRIAVQKALNAIIKEEPNLQKVEELIKRALKALAT